MLQSTLIIPSVAHLLNDWVGTTLGVSILLVGAIMEAILAEGTFDQVSRNWRPVHFRLRFTYRY